MAQTTDEIYQGIVAEKNSSTQLSSLQPTIDDEQTLLSDLNSPSKVVDWRIWAYIFALGARALQLLWDAFEIKLRKMVDEGKAGSARWLHKKGLEFQYGFSLVWDGKQYVYDNGGASEAVIEASKVAKRVAVVESGGRVIVKAATVTAGVVVPLSAPQVTALDIYLAQLSPAGTSLIVHSNYPDGLTLHADIYYDPSIINNFGESVSVPGTFPVHERIEAYLSGLPFNGVFDTTALQDAIQDAPGVKRVVITLCKATYNGIFVTIVDSYIPNAGYLTMTTTALNFQPNVY